MSGRDVGWREFFDDAYFRLNDPLFDAAASRHEVASALELLGLPLGARVLDLPCGWGRHTALLAEAGMRVWGADLAIPLLARAATSLDDAGAVGRLAAADLRALPFRDASFDATLNIGSNLGVFASDAHALNALREARRVLRPGGLLLLESMHRDDVVAGYAVRDRWTLPDGTEVRARRRFDPVSGVSREVLHWRREDASGEKRHALRLRSATELRRLVRRAGFRDLAWYGDWDGGAPTRDSPRVVVVARREEPRSSRGAPADGEGRGT